MSKKGEYVMNYEQQQYKQLLDGQQELSTYDPMKINSTRLEVQPMLKQHENNKEFYNKMHNLSTFALKRETT